MGTTGGQVLAFPLPEAAVGTAQATPSKRKRPSPAELGPAQGTVFAAHGTGSAVDCVRTAKGGRVVAKSTDGRVSVWDASGAQISAWKARAFSAQSTDTAAARQPSASPDVR